MIVSTNIINAETAFTLADNVDVEVTVLRFCSNFMEFGRLSCNSWGINIC